MIAEWFYWLTSEFGRCFNNATLMREHTPEEDMITGVFALWFFLFTFLAMILCLIGIIYCQSKEAKKYEQIETDRARNN